MDIPYAIKKFRFTKDSIACFSDNTEPLIMANFYPNQLCQAEVYDDKIIITPIQAVSKTFNS